MSIDNLDHDSIWCNETVHDILARRHYNAISVQNSIIDLRQALMVNTCPAEVKKKHKKLLIIN